MNGISDHTPAQLQRIPWSGARIIAGMLCLTACLAGLHPLHAAEPLPRIACTHRDHSVAVLVWHDVLPRKEVWFDTTIAEFDRQLAAIRRGQYRVIPLETLRRHLTEGAPIPPRAIVLTFDDNTRGLYDHVFPRLKRYRFPATLFVHTDYVGVRTVKDHCTWAQLAEMQRSGLVTVQSLTCSHPPDLRAIPPQRLDHELAGSRRAIQRQLGTTVYAIAYTEGKYDARVARAIHRHGYTLAFTEDRGNACASPNRLMIHRYSTLRRFHQALADVDRAHRSAPLSTRRKN
ncbi:MAG: polysaccharide deacetylase family protein [Chloroherpetonaceae bacterium]|nr:polysaccharide deacetylase family protein [Chthonomonadaceae bacterium]MDW8208285.1 polysaccharide deacetylase family protein [Chloroherpetonaceae bacterium]